MRTYALIVTYESPKSVMNFLMSYMSSAVILAGYPPADPRATKAVAEDNRQG